MKVNSMETSHEKQPFGKVHKAIVKGDIMTLRLLLDRDTFKIKNILNNLVAYSEPSDQKFLFELPLALAACSGKTDTLVTVMELIADMNQQDGSGNNIIHCLVLLSDEHPVVACNMYNTLMSHTGYNMRLNLLTTVNHKQHTALSLAAHICVPEIMHCILNTDGVFRFELDIKGPYREIKYKFNQQNQAVEILHQITCLPENKLKRFTDSGILHASPLVDIRHSINKKCRPMFYMWLSISVACIIAYGFYVRSYLTFGRVPDQKYSVLVVVAFGISFLEFLRNISVTRKHSFAWWRKVMSKNPPIIQIMNSTYISETLFYSMFFIIAVIDLAHPYCDDDMNIRHILHGITLLCAISSLMSVFQAYPRTSYLMAVIQKMFEETLAFSAMGFLSYAAFVAMFYILETPFQCMDTAAANDSTTNPQNLPGKMYDVFLRLLDIKIPDDVYFTESQVPAMTITVYVFAIMIWPVMLLNLLIAVYNDRMQTITQHKQVITAIQNMNIMLFAHNNYYVPLHKLQIRICKLLGFEAATDTKDVVVYTSEQLLK